jgi:hypothetical protein
MKKSVPSRPALERPGFRIARSVQSIRRGFTMSKQMTPLKRRDFRSWSKADVEQTSGAGSRQTSTFHNNGSVNFRFGSLDGSTAD